MKSKPIIILAVVNQDSDYNQLKNALETSGLDYTLIRKKTPAEGIAYVKKKPADALILDLVKPDSITLGSLKKIVDQSPDCTVIVITDNQDEQMGVEALNIGAHDYLIKSKFDPSGLPWRICYAHERRKSEKILQDHCLVLEKEMAKQTRDLTEATLKLREEIETRKEIEKTLAESEMNFRLISFSAKDAIVKMDGNGKVAFWNPAAEQIFGYSGKEIIGKNAHKLLVPPEMRGKAAEGVEEFLKTGTGKLIGQTIEMEVMHKNGSMIPVELSLASFKTGKGPFEAVSIIRDISDRRRAENRVRESRSFLQTILNTLPVPLFYKDLNGKYLGGNVAFFEFLGRQPEDVIGREVHEIVDNSEFAANYKEMDEALYRNGPSQVYETKVMRHDGSVRTVVYHKAIFKDGAGNPAGLVGIFIDITELKDVTNELTELKEHLEEIVEKRTAQLKHANATKDKFFSILAHDLKNPFNIIQGFLSLMNEEFDNFTSEEIKKFVGKALDASINTFSLLENLLEWSRSQRGTIEFKPVSIDLNEISDEALLQCREALKNKNITVNNVIKYDQMAFADPYMIRMVIRNLLNNAIKFSHPGSAITIDAVESDGRMIVKVKDQGIGMDKFYLDKLFMINEKTQRPGTNKERGTGLGLILCKEFVEKNQGEIWVESKVHEGTTFYISLPSNPSGPSPQPDEI